MTKPVPRYQVTRRHIPDETILGVVKYQSSTDGTNCCEERRGDSAAICDGTIALYLLVLHNVNR